MTLGRDLEYAIAMGHDDLFRLNRALETTQAVHHGVANVDFSVALRDLRAARASLADSLDIIERALKE